MPNVCIFLGADHGGLKLKENLKASLRASGFRVSDVGTHSEESCDYPDLARKVARAVARSGGRARGILVCGTGIGMSIAANKVPGVRAALAYDENTALLSRQHNDANVLCLGGRTTRPALAKRIVRAWLGASFEGERPEGARHQRRVQKIWELERPFRKPR